MLEIQEMLHVLYTIILFIYLFIYLFIFIQLSHWNIQEEARNAIWFQTADLKNKNVVFACVLQINTMNKC